MFPTEVVPFYLPPTLPRGFSFSTFSPPFIFLLGVAVLMGMRWYLVVVLIYLSLTLGWKKYRLESRLPGKISITSDMKMTPPLWQKVKRNKKAS